MNNNRHNVALTCPIERTFRVDQACGMFDLTLEGHASVSFDVDLPADDDDWQIGVIVGPSGSGKTSVAREAYGKRFVERDFRWPKDKSVLDGFGNDLTVQQITHILTAVGFSSPPSWVKPHAVLSRGEQFRCNLARALLLDSPIVAVDEFTSVVDRTVAQIGSAAVAKSIRKGRVDKKFVAVTCHYDILDWLEPDWVLDMASCQLARGCLHRRPSIQLGIARVSRSTWELFRRHHYLSSSLAGHARCFAAFYEGKPIALTAWVHSMTRGRMANEMRESRIVVLPDYQGIGIGGRLSNLVASAYKGIGGQAVATAAHPSVIIARRRSDQWQERRFGRVAPNGSTGSMAGDAHSCARITAGFKYVGEPMSKQQATALINAQPIKICLSGPAKRIMREMPEDRWLTSKELRQLHAPKTAISELVSAGYLIQRKIAGRLCVALP